MTTTRSHVSQTAAGKQRWHVFGDVETLGDAVIERIGKCASEAIAERGVFSIVLAGGGTPQAIYRELPELATDWRSWFVYFGDERCAPRAAPERNDAMAQRCWLDHVPIPLQQIFSIAAELGAEQGAAAYAQLLARVPTFDLVLLGLGEDGHTASLFPALPIAAAPAYAVHTAPKPPRERVTMSAARLSDARDVFFLVSGAAKREALRCWQRGDAIPAAQIVPRDGVDIFVDSEAMSN